MRQTNGINQMNQMPQANQPYNTPIMGQEYSYSGAKDSIGKQQEGVEVPLFSYAKSKAAEVKGTSAMDNFNEYRKERLEQAKEEAVDKEELEEEEKERAKELANTLSEDELRMLASMGIDVASAKLSDLQGIVSTMRQEAHTEELGRMIAKLQMENMPEEDQSFTLTNDDLVYLLRNELPITKDNLFKAHFSGSRMQDREVPADVLENMTTQISTIIEQTGYAVDVESIEGARRLLANGLPITTDSMKLYLDYQSLVGEDIKNVAIPEHEEQLVATKTEDFYNAVQTISDDTIAAMVAEDKEITIASAKQYESKHAGTYSGANQNSESYEAIKQMRMLQEIRLSMTMEAANRLVTKDFNIDTKELSKVVEELREVEQDMLSYMLHAEGIENPAEATQTYFETKQAVAKLADVPAAVLAAPLRGSAFTIRALGEDVVNVTEQTTNFEAVRRSYEAVGTAPRFDMGDRISKAFANVEDMLGEMQLPATEENVRAVRILGYNSMEITEQNIQAVVNYDREVNELIANFTPATVLSVIKEGNNPMDEPIDSLNRKLRARNDHGSVTDAENFASYLRDMEKEGIVNPAERESYIGLYRVMHQLAKSGDREVGYLFANGSELTLRNLITAMRSRKAAGLDVAVDDNFGMLEERNIEGKRMDAQIESAFGETAESIQARLSASTKEVEAFMATNGIEHSLVNASAVQTMLQAPGGIYGMVQSLLGKLSGYKDAREDAVDEETEHMSDSLAGEEVPVMFEPEHVLEQLQSSPAMEAYYQELGESLTKILYEAGAARTIATEDIAMTKTVQAGFRIMSGMAKNNQFQIPIETEEGIQVVNLSVVQGENQGRIDISMQTEAYGVLRGNFALRDGALVGQLVAETSEQNFELQSKANTFKNILTSEGYTSDGVKLGEMAELDDTFDMGQVKTTEVYEASVACIKAMRRILA